MTATPETYERAINALSRRNHELTIENQRLKKRIAELIQGQIEGLHDREAMIREVCGVCLN